MVWLRNDELVRGRSAKSAKPSAITAPAWLALGTEYSDTAKPALSNCDISWGAVAAAQGSPSSTTRCSSNGTPKAECQGTSGARTNPDAVISAFSCAGTGVVGKFTTPPCTTSVVEVDDELVVVPGPTVVVVSVDWLW